MRVVAHLITVQLFKKVIHNMSKKKRVSFLIHFIFVSTIYSINLFSKHAIVKYLIICLYRQDYFNRVLIRIIKKTVRNLPS